MWRAAPTLFCKTDLLTVPGVRFDDRTIGKTEQFCLNAAILHVEIDHTELGNVGQANAAIHAEVGQLLQQLLPLIQAKPHNEWLDIVNGPRREFPFNMPNAPHPLSRYGLVLAAARCVDDSASG